MKRMLRTLSVLLAIFLTVSLLCACAADTLKTSDESTAPTPTQSPQSGGAAFPGNGGETEDPPVDEPPPDSPQDDSKDGDDSGTGSEDEDIIPTEVLPKIWVISVNDTQKTKVTMDGGDGSVTYDLTVTLNLNVSKAAQNSPLGTYTGTANIKYSYNLNRGAYGGNADGSVSDGNAQVKLENFERERYDDDRWGDELAPLVPQDELASLIAYETMAIGSFNISGEGKVNEWTANGGQWSGSGSGAEPVYFKLGVLNGIVDVELPRLAPGVTFMGTLRYQSQ